MKSTDNSSDLAHVRHLMLRTGFTEPPHAVVEATTRPLSSLLQQRLKQNAPISPLSPPAWVNGPIPERPHFKSMSSEASAAARQEMNRRMRDEANELRVWWLESLVRTQNPLGARMTLFWQNHFTSERRKVRHAPLLYRQQATFMRHAMGNFGPLLSDMLRDPALLIYLDNRINRRQKPNENLARELLELFALGEGNYQEKDIKEMARALTGLSVDKDMNFMFRKGVHDADEKTILGTTGTLGLNEIVDILLANPATAEHLVRKLWLHFISPTPDEKAVQQWAALYRESDYDMQTLLAELFSSELFNDPSNHGQLIKSPVEFIVGTHRALEIPPVNDNSLVVASRSMQQDLYEPPNVRGWVGGTHWINSHTLLARRRFINKILRDDALDIAQLQQGLDPETVFETMLPIPFEPPTRPSNQSPLIQALRSPAYQLC